MTCPKCKLKRVGKYTYCICGYRWEKPLPVSDDEAIEQLKKIIGIKE